MDGLEIIMKNIDPLFWNKKKVFITGHTGFKGSWLALWLTSMGAEVFGYALEPDTNPNLFNVLGIEALLRKSCIADIRDFKKLKAAIQEFNPDMVIHMAAQPLVRYSYDYPLETYEVNVMGTANLLESLRGIGSVKATVIVTTDKCYDNKEWEWGYRETDPMGGHDPYSSSKGCAELVTSAYRNSFFYNDKSNNSIASARSGNVIGGGDWSNDRLVPDVINACIQNTKLVMRNPNSTRPWQHVLEPLSGYLILLQALFNNGDKYASSWNFGPNDSDNFTVKDISTLLTKAWGAKLEEKILSNQPHEANFLKLDCSKSKQHLGWYPKWDTKKSIEMIVRWHKDFILKKDVKKLSLEQINEYMS